MKNDTDLHGDGWQTRINIDEDAAPPPPKQYVRAKLATATDVSRELAKLYREARGGRIKVDDASRLANILAILSRILTDSELEARIEALEGRG
jgi:hypothetical protein